LKSQLQYNRYLKFIDSLKSQVIEGYSEETRRKVSESKKGIATRGTGWKHSEETKLKMKQSQLKRAEA
jgi:hypothetical protein